MFPGLTHRQSKRSLVGHICRPLGLKTVRRQSRGRPPNANQPVDFIEYISIIFGPEHNITLKFVTMEYLLPQIVYSLPPGIPLGFLTEQPIEAHHIITKTDVTGTSGPERPCDLEAIVYSTSGN